MTSEDPANSSALQRRGGWRLLAFVEFLSGQQAVAMTSSLTAGKFSLAVVAFYLLALAPMFVKNHFDPSMFIVAGAPFVDVDKTPTRIIVHPLPGYDGQFYYRLALNPFTAERTAFGVTFDSPPWRMQRIVYPVLAWIGSAGNPGWTPAALVIVNLLGLGVVAFFASRLTERLELVAWTPYLIVLWPGFIVTLTHDTTEITAAALLLAALDSYFANRIVRYAVLAAVTTLARETSILVFAGIACFEGFTALKSRSAWHRPLVAGAALLPFLVWREAQFHIWGAYPPTTDISWPGSGIFGTVKSAVFGERLYARYPVILRGFVVGTIAVFVGLAALVAANARQRPALAIGWVLVTCLMLLLGSEGPWIATTSYFRALTEWYVVGCLLLPKPVAWRAAILLGFSVVTMWCVAWAFSFSQVSSPTI
ncbi:MAG: hypothetical protein ACLP1D_06630 [Xanthobacteraceae bacterium]